MLELLPQRLWIANAIEVRDATNLFDQEVNAVVDLAYEERPAQLPRQITYCRFQESTAAVIRKLRIRLAASTIFELVQHSVPTAVACSAGMSRSPILAAFTVSRIEGISPQEAVQRIGKLRPLQLNPTLWNDTLEALAGDDDPFTHASPC